MASLLTVLGARTCAFALATLLTACAAPSQPQAVATPVASNQGDAPVAAVDTIAPAQDQADAEAQPTVAAPPADVLPDLPPPVASLAVSGTVGDVAASSGLITLAVTIGTISQIELTAESEVLGPDGSALAVADIPSGARFQAWGDIGEGGALVAQRVLLVSLT